KPVERRRGIRIPPIPSARQPIESTNEFLDQVNPAARIAEAGLLSRYHPLISTRIACVTHPIGAAFMAMACGARGNRSTNRFSKLDVPLSDGAARYQKGVEVVAMRQRIRIKGEKRWTSRARLHW
ncbi:MAG: hypothetical protein QOJ86_4170, partial [Bradyrhizobium sp.]|nr:hypothetical protein [Bradyrhizobium sp.]